MSARVLGPTRHRSGQAALAALALLAGAALSGCEASGDALGGDPAQSPSESSSTPSVDPVEISTNLGTKTRNVPVSTELEVTATGGTLRAVNVRAGGSALPGSLSASKTTWTASERLEPGEKYQLTSVAVRSDGEVSRTRSTFRTQDLSLDEQTYPSVAPLPGETVGVGMPVIVSFDVAVRDKAEFERHMTVTSVPKQRGSWYWISDNEAHWRPARYWKAGTDVSVDVDVNSLPAGGGVFGQESRQLDFHVGDAVVSKVNAQTHQMKTFVNGDLVRTTPITTGKPGFTTRSGVKVIIEKFRSKRMNSETVGISAGDPEAYDLDNVEYAMRVTYSGEFVHAAPWSVGYQGYSNVSHGCTGMSTDNAAWFYNLSKRGDVVEYTGTDVQMTMTNGYGDWNVGYAEYAKGSALS
jgi:lipoprotein-anchoring transpeptidase ErfK/SrfK